MQEECMEVRREGRAQLAGAAAAAPRSGQGSVGGELGLEAFPRHDCRRIQ